MEHTNFKDLLDFFYNRFLISFIICIFGSFSRDICDTMKHHTKINVTKILLTSFFGTILMCMITDMVDISFGTFVFITYVLGLWSFQLFDLITNNKVIKTIAILFTKVKVSAEAASSLEKISKELEKDKKKHSTTKSDDKDKVVDDKGNKKEGEG